MLTPARTMGSPPGSPNLSAQAPGPTSASHIGWALHKPGTPGLSTEPGLPRFGSGMWAGLPASPGKGWAAWDFF